MYREKIESLYYRAAQSEDAAIREQAQACLISKLMEKQDYKQAQEILDALPQKSPVDKEQAQANIYCTRRFGKSSETCRGKTIVCHK